MNEQNSINVKVELVDNTLGTVIAETKRFGKSHSSNMGVVAFTLSPTFDFLSGKGKAHDLNTEQQNPCSSRCINIASCDQISFHVTIPAIPNFAFNQQSAILTMGSANLVMTDLTRINSSTSNNLCTIGVLCLHKTKIKCDGTIVLKYEGRTFGSFAVNNNTSIDVCFDFTITNPPANTNVC